MDYTVVLFMLVWLVLLVLDGIGGPVYHLNYQITFYCDYFYNDNTQNAYLLRGGSTDHYFSCGAFYLYLKYYYNKTYKGMGASISFKLQTYYCDYFYQNNSTTTQNAYPCRGNYSNRGEYCGVFGIILNFSYSREAAGYCACLSFKLVYLILLYKVLINNII